MCVTFLLAIWYSVHIRLLQSVHDGYFHKGMLNAICCKVGYYMPLCLDDPKGPDQAANCL